MVNISRKTQGGNGVETILNSDNILWLNDKIYTIWITSQKISGWLRKISLTP